MPRDAFAIGFLVLVAALPAIWAAVALRRSPYTLAQSVLFFVDLLLCRFLWRVDAPAGLPLAPGQGAILVCNHRSSVDPFFVQLVAGRTVHWMVAREFVESASFGWFLKTCEVIPVGRGGIDTAATKAAIRLAQQGASIGMFPEGRINLGETFMLPVRPGAVTIALKAGVPLLPVYIQGAPFTGRAISPFFMPARVKVRFGNLIDVAEFVGQERNEQVVRSLLCRVLQEIARLAGREDFEPRFAGREWRPTTEEVEAEIAAKAARSEQERQAK